MDESMEGEWIFEDGTASERTKVAVLDGNSILIKEVSYRGGPDVWSRATHTVVISEAHFQQR